MANNLITDTNTSIRSAAWHEGIEVLTAPVFIQFIFSSLFQESDLESESEYIDSYTQTTRRFTEPESIFSDDFSYISFQV